MSTNPYPIPKRYLEPSAVAARMGIDQRLHRWASTAKSSSGAILLGPTGTGKTLAAAWLADAVARNESATWVKWIRADELSRILSDRGGSENIAILKRARLLVIDELGYERFPELFLEVLGDRHDNSRPTIVTSGLSIGKIAERYSDATVRRIVEVGEGVLVDCNAKQKPTLVAR